ncbi:hypothetical protein BJ165DRAFT_1520540 [Panaeolus papilionaceus]|nr:hypothetical protein BJ165DRAFT_1520540 [Panaeolus papilionaceus]
MSAAEISDRIYASFADLPREIYDEIVDICLTVGGTPLLRKCTMVHTALLPRVYTYLFANISFYSCIGEAAVHKRNQRIATFLSILRWRPYVACIIRGLTLYLHEDNDWLIEETGFLPVMRTLKDLGAHPTQLCLYKLPGIDYIRLPIHPKFETEVIRPILSSSVKHLTIRNCEDLPHNFLSAFAALEEIVLDRISLSAATYGCQSLPRAKYAGIGRLEIQRCLHNEAIFALLNPWCGLPFDFSALRELQCSVETMAELTFVYRALAPYGTTDVQELRLIIDVASHNGRWILGCFHLPRS